MISVGPFERVYDPTDGRDTPWYINDHCFARGDDGLWHLFGITHEEPANPQDERFLAHATAPDLLGPWASHPPVMPYDPACSESVIWAPHVIRAEGLWWMFYCGGGPSFEEYRIHAATSPDLWTWTRVPENPLIVDGFGARDPMVLKVGDDWLMYFTATSERGGGHHVVKAARSRDLRRWEPLGEVFRHRNVGDHGGPTELPFVVARDGRYFLFMCTNRDYVNTAVFESADPLRWSWTDRVLKFPSHAAEVIQDGERWFVSHCGWGQGGVDPADLEW